MMPSLRLALALGLAAAALSARAAAPEPVRWTLQDLQQVGGQTPTLWGAPQVVDGAVHFNGTGDGLMVPTNPIAGWEKFTIAILFRPQSGGPFAQRFLHIEDASGQRMTIEDRVVEGKGWYMDTFLLRGGKGQKGLPLIDPKKLHPLDQWAWGELVYDGQTMSSYVNGAPELTGTVAFPPSGPGRTSIGVRLNKVFWFLGEIKEVRFYPAALAPADLPAAP